jgi:predicted nucleotidyltransferase
LLFQLLRLKQQIANALCLQSWPSGRSHLAALRSLMHDAVMNRDAVLALLREHLPVLRERFGVRQLRLFGSFARDAAREDSDVDVLVDFGQPPDAKRFFGVQFYLEDLLGRPVDVASETALRERLRPYVERDAITV